MPYKEQRSCHCSSCPHNTQQDPDNPAICSWTPDAVAHMSEHRQAVVRLVHRLQHNDNVTWCSHDKHFRMIVVRSVVLGLRAIDTAKTVEVAVVV